MVKFFSSIFFNNASIFGGAEKEKIARTGYRDHTQWSKVSTVISGKIVGILYATLLSKTRSLFNATLIFKMNLIKIQMNWKLISL